MQKCDMSSTVSSISQVAFVDQIDYNLFHIIAYTRRRNKQDVKGRCVLYFVSLSLLHTLSQYNIYKDNKNSPNSVNISIRKTTNILFHGFHNALRLPGCASSPLIIPSIIPKTKPLSQIIHNPSYTRIRG